jgi:DNA damage-binding protein 1
MVELNVYGQESPILLILTDHPEPHLHQLVPEHGEEGLKLIAYAPAINLHMTGRPAEFFTGIVVDPTGQIAVASLYAGKLRVIDYSQAEPGEGFDVK